MDLGYYGGCSCSLYPILNHIDFTLPGCWADWLVRLDRSIGDDLLTTSCRCLQQVNAGDVSVDLFKSVTQRVLITRLVVDRLWEVKLTDAVVSTRADSKNDYLSLSDEHHKLLILREDDSLDVKLRQYIFRIV